MKVLITGADGFIARNLAQHLDERSGIEVRRFTRNDPPDRLADVMVDVDIVFHLAGVNRPQDPAEFERGNIGLTQLLCREIETASRTRNHAPVLVYSSSIQAEFDNPYGRSKRLAEEALLDLQRSHGVRIQIIRLPNVFGKWARPNYNSAVATFCHNIARGLPITVHDSSAPLVLVHVDDVVARLLGMLDGDLGESCYVKIAPEYRTTVGEVAELIRRFRDSRQTLLTERVGHGLIRALYATYVSYLPVDGFAYEVPKYEDPRGVFVEMLKTQDSGQFSFFTAHPGVTRGGHYHHSKTEKFLVLRGRARFRFVHVQTGEGHVLYTDGGNPTVVETVPGWSHDITNVGDDEMIVMLWANEIFDRSRPDTIGCQLEGRIHEST